VTHSGSEFVEVSAAGVTKAAALAEYCAERGIDAREVVAVGDMPNDLPMLQWAGWSVAVANAHPDVLQACDAHTTSNNEDGVAELLGQLAANGYVMPRRRA
jgi:hydroxymethylpyrimidine pyrophosphatase-like HAD family hydrolase